MASSAATRRRSALRFPAIGAKRSCREGSDFRQDRASAEAPCANPHASASAEAPCANPHASAETSQPSFRGGPDDRLGRPVGRRRWFGSIILVRFVCPAILPFSLPRTSSVARTIQRFRRGRASSSERETASSASAPRRQWPTCPPRSVGTQRPPPGGRPPEGRDSPPADIPGPPAASQRTSRASGPRSRARGVVVRAGPPAFEPWTTSLRALDHQPSSPGQRASPDHRRGSSFVSVDVHSGSHSLPHVSCVVRPKTRVR
jgi:hypothetical protein